MAFSGRFVCFIICMVLMGGINNVARSQEVTIINNFSGSQGQHPVENYVLSKVTQHTYIVNEYEPLESGERAQLEQMIRYGLRSYIDSKYFVSRGRASSLDSKESFDKTGTAIVRNALWIHDHPFHEEFKTFSKGTLSLAAQLRVMDGYKVESDQRQPPMPKSGVVDLYAFQRLVYDLKVAAEADVSAFLDAKLGAGYTPTSGNGGTEDSPILTELDYNLPAKDNVKQDLLALKPVPMPRSLKPDKKSKRNSRSNAFNDQVIQLLEANNQILTNYGLRFEDLQAQINDIRSERNLTANILREEMAALREMMQNFMTAGARPAPTATAGGTLAATLVFEKSQHQLTLGHKSQLSKVELDLKTDRNLIVIITGFADRSGNANFNALLSEQRANAVYKYLVDRSISPDRIVVNYFGDLESRFPNPADRKVEITYLKR